MADFGPFQEQGFEITMAEVRSLERQIIQSYRQAQTDIEERLRDLYARLAGIDPADGGYYNYISQRNRLERLQRDIRAAFVRHNTAASRTIFTAGRTSIANQYYRALYATQWAAPNLPFTAIPPALIELSVTGTNEAFRNYSAALQRRFGSAINYTPKQGTLAEAITRNGSVDLERLQRTIVNAMIEGNSFSRTASNVRDVIGREVVKDGVRTFTGSKAKAVRIVRTESIRNANAGYFAQASYAESRGIDIQKQWLATLDAVTREAHSALDTTRIDVYEQFRIGGDRALYPGSFGLAENNINCRCTTISIVEGITPSTRRGRNPVTGENEVFSFRSFSEWARDNGLRRNNSGILVAS